VSDQEPDSGVQQPPPGPESETGAADTEVFASAEFATGPAEGAAGDDRNAGDTQNTAFAAEPVEPAVAPAVAPIVAPAVVEPWPGQPGAAGYMGPEQNGFGQNRPGQNGLEQKGKGRRARWIIGLGLGYVVLAGGTAFGVIAGKSPAPVDVTAVNASAYAAPVGGGTASAGAGAKASGKASAHPSSKASASTAPTSAAPSSPPATTASPVSTVTGTVSDGTHHGDLRFFLLPPPEGPSSVQGDPDGTTQSLNDVLATYNDPNTARDSLNQLGFKTAAERTYQDSTMGANVTIQLMQFGSSSASSDWLSSFSYSGDGYQSISVPGESGAQGWSYAKDDNYELVGVYREGDTFFQVSIYGTQLIPAQDLGQVVSAEHDRLADG
jgi:hypothetical protein